MPANSMSDIVPLLVPRPETMGLRFSQGIVQQWNPDTFENLIDWRGVSLSDVPVLGSVEALSFEPGDVVGMLGWNPEGGTSSWWILGRISIPGTEVEPFVFAGSLEVRDFITASNMRPVEAFQTSTITITTTSYTGSGFGVSFTAPPSGVVRIDFYDHLSVNPSANVTRSARSSIQVREGNILGSGTIVHPFDDDRPIFCEIGQLSGNNAGLGASSYYLIEGLVDGDIYNVEIGNRVNSAGSVTASSERRSIMVTPTL